MKISNEIKAKIFGQYLLQEVLVSDRTPQPRKLDFYTTNVISMGAFTGAMLLLKTPSAITDEDAIEVANIFYGAKSTHTKETLLAQGKDLVAFIVNQDSIHDCNYNQYFNGIIHTVQYLQSRGYALPYLQYSVEQLVEAGIYKLIE